MASLDLSDAFDSRFLTKVTVYPQISAFDYEEGTYSFTDGVEKEITAVVLPNTRSQNKTAENNFTLDSILIYSMERLNVASQTDGGDVVLFEGRRYLVDSINDYGFYGAGFCSATAHLDTRERETY